MRRTLILLVLLPALILTGCAKPASQAASTQTAEPVSEEMVKGDASSGQDAEDGTHQPVRLTILCTDDLHDRSASLPYIARYVRERRSREANVLFLDAGDRVNKGDLAFTYSRGRAMYELMNACGYDAGVIGNHGGSFGSHERAVLIDSANHPILEANRTWPDDIRPRNVLPYKIFAMDGVRVAVAGCAATALNHAADTLLKVVPPLEALTPLVPKLREQADIVVVITHDGDANDLKLARAVPGIDVIIGGHSHASYAEMLFDEESQTVIHKAGAYGKLGEVVLEWDGAAIVGRRAGPVTIDTSEGADAEAAKVRNKWMSSLPAGEAPIAVPTELSTGQLAAWLAGRIREETGAGLVLLAGDAVKLGLPAGEVSTPALLKCVPRLAIVTAEVPDDRTLMSVRRAVMDARPGTIAQGPVITKAGGPRIVAFALVSYDRPLALEAIGLAETPLANVKRMPNRSLWQIAVDAACKLGKIELPAPKGGLELMPLPAPAEEAARPAA